MIISKSATVSTSRLLVRYRSEFSSLFTDRDQFLNVLKEFFTDQGPEQHLQREYLLFDIKDAGKTQIALKFVENYQQKQVRVNFSICLLKLTNREQI